MDDEGPALVKNHDKMKRKKKFRGRESITTVIAFFNFLKL